MTKANEKELGIQLSKAAIKAVYGTALEVVAAKKSDNKISKLELLGLGDNALEIGRSLMKAKEILLEIKDADSDERKELVNYTISLGVPESDVSTIINHAYLYLEGQYTLYVNHLKPIIEIAKKEKSE